MNFSRVFIPTGNVGSLVWRGDTLVDWVCGGTVFHLDGTFQKSSVAWGFPFETACATPDGRFVVVYERAGTMALLLRDGEILRELNRSYYHAKAYEYPICIWRNVGGQTLIAHCPEDYCRIDIEDAESGACLTKGERKPRDFFHSGLKVNVEGTRLLSAGWAWHPWSNVVYFDISEALRNPAHLDQLDNMAPGSFNVGLAEHASACWQTNERVLVGASSEEEDPTEVVETNASALRLRTRARGIAVYDVPSQSYIRSVVLDEVAGTMMPLGENHAVCFYKHPRVVSLDSGETILGWDDLDTGSQVGSIIWDKKVPPLAIDSEKRRFAVAGRDGITVIRIDLAQ
jgi:hypothetical protein